MQEELLTGWQRIGSLFGLSGRAFKRRYGDEVLRLGVAWKMRRGSPPRITVNAWRDVLIYWTALRQRKFGSLDG
jgi:hypothetical protein